jgi:spore coat polysaccharide biosynthesis protein SpsF
MRTRAGIILQARFASSRLPGKALATIGDRTVLELCLRRLMFAGVAPVVLATTQRPEDDALESAAKALGIGVFRGDTNDVLGRFLSAADAFDFEIIIRATGDNPCVDIQAPGRLLGTLRACRADYAGEDGLPYGAAVEAVTRDALMRAGHETHHAEDREHVTTYVRRNTQRFHVVLAPAPAPLCRPDMRVTVDTAADLEHVRVLYARTGLDMPSLRDLIEAAGGPFDWAQGRPVRREVA